jgi:hypothetical protein
MSRPSSGARGPNDFATNPAAAAVANREAATATHHHDLSTGKIIFRRSEEESIMLS